MEDVTADRARRYPTRPVVGVGAVVFVESRIVLVRRRFEPLAGQWSLPGGALEVGETLQAGIVREVQEETGLEVRVGPVVDVFDRIMLDAEGRVSYHYVLVDFLCHAVGGVLAHGSDVSDVALTDAGDLARFALTEKAAAVIARAKAMADETSDRVR